VVEEGEGVGVGVGVGVAGGGGVGVGVRTGGNLIGPIAIGAPPGCKLWPLFAQKA